jgi:GH25 family lysozyme M1 (1,4-beta-N-acetylmuramidase)
MLAAANHFETFQARAFAITSAFVLAIALAASPSPAFGDTDANDSTDQAVVVDSSESSTHDQQVVDENQVNDQAGSADADSESDVTSATDDDATEDALSDETTTEESNDSGGDIAGESEAADDGTDGEQTDEASDSDTDEDAAADEATDDAADDSTDETSDESNLDETTDTSSGSEVVLFANLNALSTSTGLNGIDISSNQGNPDNGGLNPASISADFIIVKVTEGISYVNPYWKRQVELALSSGKLVGLYHFARSNSSMTNQADYFVSNINSYSSSHSGVSLLGQCLLFLDWENAYYDTGTLATGPSNAKVFLDRVASTTGVEPVIYMSASTTRSYDWSTVKNSGYNLWVAQYLYRYTYNPSNSYCRTTPLTNYESNPVKASAGYGAWGSDCLVYQYTSTGKLSGYSGFLDFDKYYGTRSDWLSLASLSWQKGSDGNWYHYSSGNTTPDKGWLVTSEPNPITGASVGLQRYWLNSSTGALAINRIVKSSEGSGYDALATSYGYVLRGAGTYGGKKYYADNDGRLASGWVVTSSFGQGLQRYWFDPSSHTTVTGYSTAGWAHYTTPAGYVLRGAGTYGGKKYYADNDGLLASGWVVTSSFGQGLQRYWFDPSTHTTVTGYSTAGWAHYTRPEGFVVRGAYKASDGYVYIANNDGLIPSAGWVVGNYGQGFQRYWVDSAAHACVPGYSTAGWAHYTRPEGYVVRGAYRASDGYVYIANNDGLIPSSGWVVSSAYGQGLQRYWVDSAAHACIPGYSAAGWAHYTTPAGYVLRGTAIFSGKHYTANNDGLIVKIW